MVAYNPDNCNKVWVKEKDGSFVEFSLIESRFEDMALNEAFNLKEEQKLLVNNSLQESYQAKIELMRFIETMAEKPKSNVKTKNVRDARRAAVRKEHKDIGGTIDD